MSPSVCDLVTTAAAAPAALPVLVVTGLAREAKIAEGPGVETLCSGGIPARLREILNERPAPNCRAVVSFGVAGGLDPALKPGDLVLATKIVSETGEWAASEDLLQALDARLAGETRLRTVRAPLAGVDLALGCAVTKRAAYGTSGAAAVDMESHIAAEYAARHDLPFAAIRVVCDPAHRGLPPVVNVALTPEGGVALPRVLGSLMRRPGQIVDLFHLGRDAKAAFGALALIALDWVAALD